MTNSVREIVSSVYNPPIAKDKWSLEKAFDGSQVRYFAYGRWALAEALQVARVHKGDRVLLPEFICRDVLASAYALGAEVEFYPVGKNLEPSTDPKHWPVCKAVIAVNYFGFPQSMMPFEAYSRQNGAVLIEDNAHGFLSRTSEGKLLGTRSEFGVLSIRKTLRIPNGAALLVNNEGFKKSTLEQVSFSNGRNQTLQIKRQMGRFAKLTGPKPFLSAIQLARTLRKARTGFELPQPDPLSEVTLPNPKEPSHELLKSLSRVDESAEVSRRRKLYEFVESEMKLMPVFRKLDRGTAPYTFPFYAEPSQIEAIRTRLASVSLDCFPWPDLPGRIVPAAPEHYKNLWSVRFLW